MEPDMLDFLVDRRLPTVSPGALATERESSGDAQPSGPQRVVIPVCPQPTASSTVTAFSGSWRWLLPPEKPHDEGLVVLKVEVERGWAGQRRQPRPAQWGPACAPKLSEVDPQKKRLSYGPDIHHLRQPRPWVYSKVGHRTGPPKLEKMCDQPKCNSSCPPKCNPCCPPKPPCYIQPTCCCLEPKPECTCLNKETDPTAPQTQNNNSLSQQQSQSPKLAPKSGPPGAEAARQVDCHKQVDGAMPTTW
eukprot:bmy_19014T0